MKTFLSFALLSLFILSTTASAEVFGLGQASISDVKIEKLQEYQFQDRTAFSSEAREAVDKIQSVLNEHKKEPSAELQQVLPVMEQKASEIDSKITELEAVQDQTQWQQNKEGITNQLQELKQEVVNSVPNAA